MQSLAHPAFQAGVTFTNFLEENALLENETPQQANSDQANVFQALIAAAVYDFTRIDENRSQRNGHIPSNPWQALGPWRMIGETRKTTYIHSGTKHQVALSPSKDISGAWLVQIDTRPAQTISTLFGNNDLVLLRKGSSHTHTFVRSTESEVQVILDGVMYFFEKSQPPNVDVAAHGGNKVHSQKTLTAPMAGTIIKVQVRNGEIVYHRQVLVILSAMKMEHSILAPYEGKVRRVHYHEGDVVKGGAVIVEME